MESSDYTMNNKATGVSCNFQANWVIAHGTIEDSITVESSDNPIDESELENTPRKSPLFLKPPGPDHDPCEIKICFEQKYEICQIYVRSTARVYEVYYARSPRSSDEYLCTVRCGVAERDEKLLQTDCFQDLVEENGGSSSTSEDDWVNIKVPEVNTNRVKKVQDFYEATAQMTDVDPCSMLTIRLLSLQDKGHIYIDEVYIFVERAESTDCGNEAVLAGSSAQSSLMAMFVPTLLQLSKSRQVQDKQESNKLLQNDEIATGSRKISEIEKDQVPRHYVTPEKPDRDKAESAKQPEHVEPTSLNEFPPQNPETSLEQLISRVTKIEDICLRFEEKLLKPIESIEARLERVEHQLETLTKNSHHSFSTHGTRISAPSFSCTESNSSSFHNEQSENPPCGPQRLEDNDASCKEMPDLSHDADFHPSFVVTAPECSCSDKEENDELKPLEDSPIVIPKKTLSVDDALAAALNGFLSSAVIHPSEQIQTKSDISREADDERVQEFPDEENGKTEPSRYAQVLTVKAPDFAAEEIGNEEYLNNATHSSLDMGSATKDVERDNSDDDTGLCDFIENNVTPQSMSESNGHLNGSSEVKMINGYFKGEETSFASDSESKDEERSATEEEYLKDDDTLNVSEPSHVSLLDFEFPILEVKFTSNEHGNTKSPLEVLLDGEAESNTEAPLTHANDEDVNNEETNDVVRDGDETKHLLPVDHLLVDVGVSDADKSSILDGGPSSLEMNVSLI